MKSLVKGGTIAAAQLYNPQETDFRDQSAVSSARTIWKTGKKEYEGRVKEWFKKQSLKTRNSPRMIFALIADFDAIFVPDSPKAIGQIAPMLTYQGVTKVRLIGTNIWNSGEFVRRGQKNVEKALFVDSNITSDPGYKTSRFFQEYKKIFGEEPGLFEAQGYEVGVMLRQLISGGETTRVGLAQALTNIRLFQGVSGPMSMNAHRELVRPLIPLTVVDGAILTWSPHSRNPGGAG